MPDRNLPQPLICMVGTDHVLAPADVRSNFVIPAEKKTDAIQRIRDTLGASGVALVATCNRTELWASFDSTPAPERSVLDSGEPRSDDPLLQALCHAHCLDPVDYARYFRARDDEEAVEHLFHMSCGLRSAIMAEDQVISQVKQTIAFSREHRLADSCLEVLFREAVTAAKNVKSTVRFTRAYGTAVDAAIDKLKQAGFDLSQTTCMVIGNGEYGRLAASTLAQHDADVRVTVRQYTHGYVAIPAGCTPIPYADRYEHLSDCDVVMSATTSPHYTLSAHEFDMHRNKDGMIVFDLAIPHDVDPAIGNLAGCQVFDIDQFSTNAGIENAQAVEQARIILDNGAHAFWDWVVRRNSPEANQSSGTAFFPLFVDLSSRRAVFVGGGTIALRRVRTLLPFVGDLTVVAPEVSPEIAQLADDGALTWIGKRYYPGCLDGADIVFACTNDSALNDEIWQVAHDNNQLANVCSDRSKCDFYFPGVAQYDNVVVGISAGGKNHRQVRQLRQRIERLLEEEDI